MEKGKTTLDFLMEHAEKKPISFHMPGHKGGQIYRRFGYGDFLDNIMDCDITEIPGADNLFQAEGILERTQQRYAKLYDVERSYMLINGTSGGIIASILASVPEDGQLIMARNCHKSVFNALSLGNIQPAYIYPDLIEAYGILGKVSPKEVELAIEQNPQASAVILPSPNYYGICSDIQAIAEIVHKHDKIFIVDQAHGAHLKWMGRMAYGGKELTCAEDAGADIVINSIHKTLASFTQSAILNLNSSRIDRYTLEDKLQMIQSTSPSYLMMASLDINAELLEQQRTLLMGEWRENIRFFYEGAKHIPGIRMINNLENLDYTKINIDVSQLGITAAQMEQKLVEKGVFPELATGNILMFMTGIGNQRDDFERLRHSLWKIATSMTDRKDQRKKTITTTDNGGKVPKKTEVYPVPKKKERVLLEQAEGRICTASVIPYPPGIPLICPGEKFEKEEIQYIKELRNAGEKVIGVNDQGQVTVGE